MFDDPSNKTELYNLLSSDILDLHAPLKKVKARKHNVSWITRDLCKKMIYHDCLHRNFLQACLNTDYERYRQHRNQVTKWQRLAKICLILWQRRVPLPPVQITVPY